jgi:transglutaminase-like putative cysteine protease
MMFDISHRTRYVYSEPVIQSQHLAHLSPRLIARQTVRHHSIIVEPAPALRRDMVDALGNPATLLDIEVPHKELVVLARSLVDVAPPPPIGPETTTPWDRLDGAVAAAPDEERLDLFRYRCASRATPRSIEIAEFAAPSFAPGRPALDCAIDLARRIHAEFKFDPRATDVSTPVGVVLRQRRGVCQDFAHLALACLRLQGIPARYVSGYILTRPPPGQPKLQGADASHAWVSVWSPETGWVDLDPTNGLVVGDEHISFAYGRDFDDISPLTGVLLGGGAHTVHVSVDVVDRPATESG